MASAAAITVVLLANVIVVSIGMNWWLNVSASSQTGCSPHGSWAVGTAAEKSARSRQQKPLAHVAIDAKLHQEEKMADDKSKRDFRERDRVAAEDDREIEYFAQQNGITADQVRQLIKSFGNDRGRLTVAAKALRGISPAGADEVTREARQQATPMHLGKPDE
ncbi:DUF3606 domain-containing protein [Mesorhizobium sp. M1027]|uniref:DUF3606 domain-containing protein n=1 Tax=Mesorhizobium sp. M1027 TaxID=2957050 RepID=UPI00333E01CB